MSRDNVKRVLATKGNQAVLPVGKGPDALALGQIGVFDANTNLSIDSSKTPAKFFVAVGIDSDGDGVVDDIKESAGQEIQSDNLRGYTFRPHTASRAQIIELQGIVDADVEVDKEFALKFEFRNHRIYKLQGTNAFTNTYTVKSTGSTAASLAQDFVDAINAHSLAAGEYEKASLQITGSASAAGDVIVTLDGTSTNVAVALNDTAVQVADKIRATTFAGWTTGGDDGTDTVTFTADVRGVKTDATYNANGTGAAGTMETVTQGQKDVLNEGAFTSADLVDGKLQVTSQPLKVNKALNLNLLYNDLRETVIVPSVVEGFSSATKFATIQDIAFEEGDGAQIRQAEYNETGVARPYVLSEATGTARDLQYNAEGGTKYDQIVIEYDGFSVAGWREHLNNLETRIAIPDDDTTTRDGLIGILDAQFTPKGFDALADDATASNTDDTVVEPTEDRTESTDGIA